MRPVPGAVPYDCRPARRAAAGVDLLAGTGASARCLRPMAWDVQRRRHVTHRGPACTDRLTRPHLAGANPGGQMRAISPILSTVIVTAALTAGVAGAPAQASDGATVFVPSA